MKKYIWAKGDKITYQNLPEKERNIFHSLENQPLTGGYAYFNISRYEVDVKIILCIAAVVAMLLFLYGIALGKIPFLKVLGWSFSIFAFLFALMGIDYFFASKPHKSAGLLLTDNDLVYFWNDNTVYVLPLEDLAFKILENNLLVFAARNGEVVIDPSGFVMDDLKKFLCCVCEKSPKLEEEVLGRFIEKSNETA